MRQVEAGASVAAVARRHEIHPTLLSKWRQQLHRDPERAFQRDPQPHDEQVQVNELEQMVGRLTMEERPVKKGLGAARGVSPAERRVFKDKMITLIEQQRETGAGLSLAAMCRALEVPRSAYYRARQQPAGDHETAPRDAIQRIALEMPAYGSRRITAELRRQGWVINRKRVQRLMRQDNLLCLRRKKFIRTTDSEHGLAVYPNLVPTLDISGLNQLWVSDITYIRLWREFVYLAVVLDAFSRRVIGWSLGPHSGGGVGSSRLTDGLADT